MKNYFKQRIVLFYFCKCFLVLFFITFENLYLFSNANKKNEVSCIKISKIACSYYFEKHGFSFNSKLDFYFKKNSSVISQFATIQNPNFVLHNNSVLTKIFIVQNKKTISKQEAMLLAFERIANTQLSHHNSSLNNSVQIKKEADIIGKNFLYIPKGISKRIGADHVVLLNKEIGKDNYKFFRSLMLVKNKKIVIFEIFSQEANDIENIFSIVYNSFFFFQKPIRYSSFQEYANGVFLFASDLQDEAYKSFHKSIRIDKNNFLSYFYLGILSSSINAKKSSNYYKKTIQIQPHFTPAYLNLLSLSLKHNLKLGKKFNHTFLLNAIEKDYDYREDHCFFLGYILMKEQKLSESIALLEECSVKYQYSKIQGLLEHIKKKIK